MPNATFAVNMEKYAEIDGVKVHYTVEGEGKPLILMHGWGCNTTTLASVEKVALESHKVYNIDFPGHGKSQEPGEVWGIERYTRILEEIIKREGIERPSLLGHSFGGRVGIFYSSRHDDVDKLILVDAAGIKPRRSIKYYVKVYSYKAWKRLLYMSLGREKAEKKLDAYRSKVGSSDYAQASPMMRAILSKVVNEDLKSVMPSIKAETLLVWGENDTATPLSDAKYMEKHGIILSITLADGALQVPEMEDVISECPELKIAIGHFGMVTMPDWMEQIKLARHKNVMIESGGITWLFNSEFYPFDGAVRAIREAADAVGMDKLMWGSDYPRTITAITYRMSYDFIIKSPLMTTDEKRAFLGENAKRFYDFKNLIELPYIKNMSE